MIIELHITAQGQMGPYNCPQQTPEHRAMCMACDAEGRRIERRARYEAHRVRRAAKKAAKAEAKKVKVG